MHWTELFPQWAHLTLHAMTETTDGVCIALVSTSEEAACTTCHVFSTWGHGSFTRPVQSLPLAGRSARLTICARRFRCRNPACPRITFREDLSAVVPRYQRRTAEVTRLLQCLGCEVGGKAGERLATQFRLSTSRSTVLRVTQQIPTPVGTPPRVVGVDEFAWKKGRTYGTIVVDLEAHCVLALLPDREIPTVVAWLRAHPSIRLVTRDRSGAFADAIRQGAPQALQIADRFHLAMNATACFEAIVTREHAVLCQVVQTLRQQERATLPPPPPTVYFHQRVSQSRRTRRQDRYEQMLALHEQGWSKSAIARELGIHRDTIARYLIAEQFPERAPRTYRPRTIMPFVPYLQRRWAEGEHNGFTLHRELQAIGYLGGATMVSSTLRPWRKGAPADPRIAAVAHTWPYYSPRQTVWLLFKHTADEAPTERTYCQAVLAQSALIAQALPLIQRFRHLLTERDEVALRLWAPEAEQSGIPELVNFVQGLYRDWEAVENALLFPLSQGQVEGSVNRVKLVKRQSYGRASPSLLQARVRGARSLYRI